MDAAKADLLKKHTDAVNEGKGLDVSNLRFLERDGQVIGVAGAVKHAVPKTDKGKYKWVKNDNIFIFSDNYTAYKAAVDLIGRSDLAVEYKKMHPTLVKTGPSGKTPKSPKKEKALAKSFSEKLREAVEKAERDNKVVNVSGLHKNEKGEWAGYLTQDRMTKAGVDKLSKQFKGTTVSVPGTVLISNNYETFAEAAKALGQPELAREFAQIHKKTYDHRTAKGSRSPAGKKSPGAKAAKLSAAEHLYVQYSKAYENRGNGAYLDVSKLTDGGLQSRVIYPKDQSKSFKKVGVDGINVVSDNHRTFALAMDLLDEVVEGGNFHRYADEYYRLHKAAPGPRVVASPKGGNKRPTVRPLSRSASPVRRSTSAERRMDDLLGGPLGSVSRGRANSGSTAERLARAVSRERLSASAERRNADELDSAARKLERLAESERENAERLERQERAANAIQRMRSASGSKSLIVPRRI